jgi:hypothetical protein
LSNSKADVHLSYAFNSCDVQMHRQRKYILKFLIVCRIVRGSLPSKKLLQIYNMGEYFGDIIHCVSTGNLEGYENALDKQKQFFLSLKCYAIMKHLLKPIIYRNFFYSLYSSLFYLRYQISASISMKDSNQLSLDTILECAKYLNRDFNFDDVESILLSLLDQSIVKGYLIHSRRVVVFSKFDPFPEIYSTSLTKRG